MEVVKEHGSAFDALLHETRPVAAAFHRAGKRLYLVGGIVRDGLRGRQRLDLDIDLTSDALPDEIEAIMTSLRPTALWLQGKRFGTIGARLVGPDGGDRAYEVTAHRSDSYALASRKPEVAFSDNIVVDLSRRDFTVNAIAVDAMSPAGGAVLVDPFSGLDDLRHHRLRTPLDPEVSFSDDPLRMLRAARFVAGHELVADPALLGAIHDLRARLAIVSAERVRDEFSKLLLLPRPVAGLALLARTTLLDVFAAPLCALGTDPALLDRVGVVLADCPDDLTLRLAVLFALATRCAADVDTIAYDWAIGLRFALDDCSRLRMLLRLRTAFPDSSDLASVRGFVRQSGELSEAVQMLVRLTDGNEVRSASVRTAIQHLSAVEGLDMSPTLDGVAVMAHLGVGPGRSVGEALAMLLDVRLREGRVGPDEERRLLDRWWAVHQKK